jgi:hypothetical protein
MATYASYKKLNSDYFSNASVNASDLASPLNTTYGVKWFYGSPLACTAGCCCLWTIPTGVKKITIDAWGAGGNGAGSCSNGRCQHFMGGGGGYYNSKTIDVTAGWTYTVCAGGVYPCCSQECNGCPGCASYVTGCNLSGFCAIGGMNGRATGEWTEPCNSENYCCLGPNDRGGDWLQTTQSGPYGVNEFVYDRGFCHCYNQAFYANGAALIGTVVTQSLRECWIRCGCWIVPYGSAGQNAMSTYCGGNCGQGGTGGGGLVKITYF